ncbi:LacI family DNA-binding transcriptional regulator [Virgibacillus ihumii]|uniref:LacI family DNA-binding transcriptional regulator n=1 Tax=Virgibacillus ihumii TaxID=2686091 RepID=UPI00157E0644|nr:substrate-binding domain-containing protein [Virgibacillus ihumii]
MSPTIKDVAKKADVSIATVSRILNDLPGYSENTKNKVLAAIKELNYQPNAIARGLINKKTQTLGVLFPDVSGMLSSEILRGIESKAHELGHSVIVCNTSSNGKKTMKYLQLLKEKQVDGVIFASEEMTEDYYTTLKAMDVPVVLVSTSSYKFPLPYVKVDDRHAAYSATEFLIRKGHTHIGMISGCRQDKIAGEPRVEGYKQAMKEHDLSVKEDNIASNGGFGFKDGAECFPVLLNRFPEMTALFAASDEIAIGAISMAHQLGIQVPDDLSVIGYDNTKLSEMSIPPLTALAQPLFEMGYKSANTLFQMLRTGKEVGSYILPHTIVERQSVKDLT